MSKLKSISRARWFAAGVGLALLLVPTAVGATVGTQAALKFTGIEGTSGNQADVSGAGQLLTAEAAPSSYIQTTDVEVSTAATLSVLTQPTGNHAQIITTIHITVISDDGTALPVVGLQIDPGSTCPDTGATWAHDFTTPTVGETDVPYAPGLVIAKGSALCGVVQGDAFVFISVSGYNVPSADAPTSS